MAGATAVAEPRCSYLSLGSPDPRQSEALPLFLFDAGEDALGEPNETAAAEDERIAQEPHGSSIANGRESQLVATHVPSTPPLIALRSKCAV